METYLLLVLLVGALFLLWRVLTTLLRVVGVVVSAFMALRTLAVASALPGLAGGDLISSLLPSLPSFL